MRNNKIVHIVLARIILLLALPFGAGADFNYFTDDCGQPAVRDGEPAG